MALFENPDQLRQLQELLYPNRNRRGGNADSSTDSEDEGQSLVVTKAQGKRDRHLLQLSLSHTRSVWQHLLVQPPPELAMQRKQPAREVAKRKLTWWQRH